MSLLGTVSQLLRRKHARAFEAASKNPRAAQWQKLKAILSSNSKTEFGKKYGFGSIGSIAEYQAKVPVFTHKELKPYLDRMVNGEKNILTFEEPVFYGITTGSSGTPKLTPITPAYREEYQNVVHTFLYHVCKEHPGAFNGKVLYFNGSAEKGRTPAGIPYGTMSGFNFVNLPNLVKKFYAVPYEVTVINDSYSRFYSMALLSLPQNITMMIGITGAPIITFINRMQENTEGLLRDLYNGGLSAELELTRAERAVVMERHRANPAVAGKLSKLFEKKGKLSPVDIWPGLDLLICWKSSNAGGFIKEMNTLFENKIPIRDAIYSATEGWCNIPYTDKVIGGPLALNAHFYEFFEENDANNEKVLLTDELESGKKYRILYTTSAGIYRYDIGDILEVTGMYNNTPCVKFSGKVGQACNIAGELITEYHVTEAVINASNKFNILIPFYTLVPNQEGFPPYYSLLIELPEGLSSELQKQIAAYIDEQLCEINIDYRSLREDNELGTVSLKLAARGSMEVYRKQQVKMGADEAQVKPLVLALDMSRLSEIEIIGEVKLVKNEF